MVDYAHVVQQREQLVRATSEYEQRVRTAAMTRALLGAYGKNATDLARLLGVTAQAASAKLRCERRFTDAELDRAAAWLGVTVEQLKDGDPLAMLGVASTGPHPPMSTSGRFVRFTDESLHPGPQISLQVSTRAA